MNDIVHNKMILFNAFVIFTVCNNDRWENWEHYPLYIITCTAFNVTVIQFQPIKNWSRTIIHFMAKHCENILFKSQALGSRISVFFNFINKMCIYNVYEPVWHVSLWNKRLYELCPIFLIQCSRYIVLGRY